MVTILPSWLTFTRARWYPAAEIPKRFPPRCSHPLGMNSPEVRVYNIRSTSGSLRWCFLRITGWNGGTPYSYWIDVCNRAALHIVHGTIVLCGPSGPSSAMAQEAHELAIFVGLHAYAWNVHKNVFCFNFTTATRASKIPQTHENPFPVLPRL